MGHEKYGQCLSLDPLTVSGLREKIDNLYFTDSNYKSNEYLQ